VTRRVRIVSHPWRLRFVNRGSGRGDLVAVIVGASWNRRACAYSIRISVGVSTSNRAGPAVTTSVRARAVFALAGAAKASATPTATPVRLVILPTRPIIAPVARLGSGQLPKDQREAPYGSVPATPNAV
jgi:hypothetical protein